LQKGIRHVGEAAKRLKLERVLSVEAIFFSPDLLRSEFALNLIDSAGSQPGYAMLFLPELFTSLAEKENPQGIMAVVGSRKLPGRSDPANFKWGVALIAPQDPGNIGTILRTLMLSGQRFDSAR
jgi:RNA methyltransferase, TrmH family